MPRITALTAESAPEKSRPLLAGAHKAMGMTPNMFAALAHSPAALGGYLNFSQALGTGSLSSALREQIAVAVAGENACGYCASAHSALGRMSGVDDAELAANLRGEASDSRTQAALDFARTIVAKQGWIEDAQLAAIRDAGFSEGEVVEIIANVAINIFTNYFNHIADTVIDFPEVKVPAPVGV